MSKKKVNLQKIIKDITPIFEKYTDLTAFPIYAWGRYYKYELRGEPFDSSGYAWSEGISYGVKDVKIDWKLISKIEKEQDFNIHIPDRKEWAYEYGDDERGGQMAVAIKDKKGKIKIEFYDCDSPE